MNSVAPIRLSEEQLLQDWTTLNRLQPPPKFSTSSLYRINKNGGGRKTENEERDQEIIRLTLEGLRPAEISRRMELEAGVVNGVLDRARRSQPELGLDKAHRERLQRNSTIMAWHKNGYGPRAIAKKLGVSEPAVVGVIKRMKTAHKSP